MAVKKKSGHRIVVWCIMVLGTGLAIVAVLYLVEGKIHDAVSYGMSLSALVVAYAAWYWAQGRLARAKKEHR